MADSQWKGTTFGSEWMHDCIIRILSITNIRVVYVFANVFVIPFCLIFSSGSKAAYTFFRKRLCYGTLMSIVFTYRNLCSFATVVIDRFAMYAGKRFDVEIEGRDLFESLAAKEEGFLHLSSHIGNYEIAGYSLDSDKKNIHAVVYFQEKEYIMRNRNSMFSKTNVSMIAIMPDMSHLFEIDKAICKGDIVSFPSDRHLAGTKCILARFLGAEAKFPLGPFSVATIRGINVLSVNVMKVGTTKYKIYLTLLPYDRSLPRMEQVQVLCNEYVTEMERMVRLYPTQWYNFYDFWE